MKTIDLHVHSNASDGTLTPAEVVRLAEASGLSYIALTDHDTTAGISEAKAAAKHLALTILPGIEMSCHYKQKEIHILGLCINPDNETLQTELSAIVKNREERNQKMIARFQASGYPVTLEKLQASNPDTIITRAHFARVLVEEGICSNKDQAFRRFLNPDKPFYIKREYISPEKAIGLIKLAGGLPVLAHPLLYKFGYREISSMLEEFQSYGLAGVEVYHSSNNPYESKRLKEIADSLSLIVTGGSDFHGANKPDISIGTGRGGLHLPEQILFDILDRYPQYAVYRAQ